MAAAMPKKTKLLAFRDVRRALEEVERLLRKLVFLRAGKRTKARIQAVRRENDRRAVEVEKLMKEQWEKMQKRQEEGGSDQAAPDVH